MDIFSPPCADSWGMDSRGAIRQTADRPSQACSGFVVAVSVLARSRHVEGGISVKESLRLKHEARVLYRHHGPVLRADGVVGAERVPDHHVVVLYGAILLRPLDQPVTARILVRIRAGGMPFGVLVRGHPEMLAGKPGALGDLRVRLR